MKPLATDVLRKEKCKCTFWKIATVIVLADAVVELLVIIL